MLLTSGYAEAATRAADAEGVRILPKTSLLAELAAALQTARDQRLAGELSTRAYLHCKRSAASCLNMDAGCQRSNRACPCGTFQSASGLDAWKTSSSLIRAASIHVLAGGCGPVSRFRGRPNISLGAHPTGPSWLLSCRTAIERHASSARHTLVIKLLP